MRSTDLSGFRDHAVRECNAHAIYNPMKHKGFFCPQEKRASLWSKKRLMAVRAVPEGHHAAVHRQISAAPPCAAIGNFYII
jgi:hypothetical protein